LLTVSRFLSHDYPEILETAVPEIAQPTERLLRAEGPLRILELPFLRAVYVWGECSRAWARDHTELLQDGVEEALLAAVEGCVTPADPAVVIYSSGSTADPKGAIHTHGTLVRHSYNLASQRDLLPSDRIWSAMPFFWVGGLVFSVLGNMHVGATTLCEEVFDPESTLDFLERERATIALGWPHFGKALAEHPSFPQRDLSSLRSGNVPDILPDEIVHPDPSRRRNALGMTESCGPHTWDSEEGPLPEERRGAFGFSLEGVEHRIVDPDTGEPMEPGELGEICLRGYSLMQGLYKHEREDVFELDGFYRTGDAGYFDAKGELYFKGRLGEMIKSAGANVTPSEVEAVLLTFEEVKQAYVVGVDHPERGQTVEAAVVLELDRAAEEIADGPGALLVNHVL
jgi:acyl-coenzyme A synthetase/AMP-(fatty) acid ligase